MRARHGPCPSRFTPHVVSRVDPSQTEGFGSSRGSPRAVSSAMALEMIPRPPPSSLRHSVVQRLALLFSLADQAFTIEPRLTRDDGDYDQGMGRRPAHLERRARRGALRIASMARRLIGSHGLMYLVALSMTPGDSLVISRTGPRLGAPRCVGLIGFMRVQQLLSARRWIADREVWLFSIYLAALGGRSRLTQ